MTPTTRRTTNTLKGMRLWIMSVSLALTMWVTYCSLQICLLTQAQSKLEELNHATFLFLRLHQESDDNASDNSSGLHRALYHHSTGTTTLTTTTTTTTTTLTTAPSRHEKTVPNVSSSSSSLPILDILSIGSEMRPDRLAIQQATFATHAAVRHFYAAAERDDAEVDCHTNLTKQQVRSIYKYCHYSFPVTRKHAVLSQISKHFMPKRKLLKRPSTALWLCAQKRPLQAFGNLLQRHYQHRAGYKTNAHTPPRSHYDASSLPDYLLIVDDDTWINVEAMLPFLKRHYPSHEAHAVAGCLMVPREDLLNMTVPFGGYGLFLTRGALQNWLRPITCPTSTVTPINTTNAQASQEEEQDTKSSLVDTNDQDSNENDFDKLACQRLQENGIGEAPLFRNGMSIADLAIAYSVHTNYLDVAAWDRSTHVSFCMQSDWAWAYFVNSYPVTQALPPEFRHFPNDNNSGATTRALDRLLGYNGSLVHPFETEDAPESSQIRSQSDNATLQQCANGRDFRGGSTSEDSYCDVNAHICHEMTTARMRLLHTWNWVKTPHHYPATLASVLTETE